MSNVVINHADQDMVSKKTPGGYIAVLVIIGSIINGLIGIMCSYYAKGAGLYLKIYARSTYIIKTATTITTM